MQRRKFVFWSILLSLFLLPLWSQANVAHDNYGFVGKWVNTDHYADDLTKVIITESHDYLYVNVVGNCGYEQCRWGKKKLRKIGKNKYKAVYQSKRDSKAIIVSLDSYKKLRVKCVIYDDCGTKTDYYTNYFKKARNNHHSHHNQHNQYDDYNGDHHYKSKRQRSAHHRRYEGRKGQVARPRW